jgi:lipid-A-disaccharide synthase
MPDVAVAGLGGPQLAAAGGRLIDDYRGIAVTGLTEVLTKLPKSAAALRRLVAYARDERPDALVIIDFPEINLRLARAVRQLGIPVIYYIAPQIWAWRPWRLKTIREVVDRVLVIFPFEEVIYRDGRVAVEFVGHPLVDLVIATTSREHFLAGLGLDPLATSVAVLPGSRPNEVSRILPDLLAACRLIADRVPGVQFVVARAPHLDAALFRGAAGSPGLRIATVEGETDAVLASVDVALTASGTATVQAALHDVPMVVVYRLSPLTYRLGRRFVKVDTFAMVNLIAGERIVPELIQDAFTPAAVAGEATSMLTDCARARTIREGLQRVRASLGGAGASRRAAAAIVRVIAAAAATSKG